MFLLAFMITVQFFFTVGVAIFVAFVTTANTRQYALSAALWCACWGPCVVALEMLAGLALAAEGLALHHWGQERISLPPMSAWSIYAVLGLLGTTLAATVLAWLHQMMIGRMTFALFRIYATAVTTGMGFVAGLVWWLWLATLANLPGRLVVAPAGMALLMVTFGCIGWRFARGLRGRRPEHLQWVSPEEFEGVR